MFEYVSLGEDRTLHHPHHHTDNREGKSFPDTHHRKRNKNPAVLGGSADVSVQNAEGGTPATL